MTSACFKKIRRTVKSNCPLIYSALYYKYRNLHMCYAIAGMHVIGAIRTNRFIYPSGIRIQVKEVATHIDEKNTDLMTVGKEQDRVYHYEGTLNALELGEVVLY